LHDVSEGMATKRTLARAAEIDASLAELSKSLIADLTMEEIAELVKEQALRFTDSQHAFVGFITTEGMRVISSLTPQEWDGPPENGEPVVVKEFGGLWGWVLTHGQSLMTNDPAADPRSTGSLEWRVHTHRSGKPIRRAFAGGL